MGKMDLVFEKLKEVIEPTTGKDIVSLGLVKDVAIEGNKVSFVLSVPMGANADELRKAARHALLQVDGIDLVSITIEGKKKIEPPKLRITDESGKGKILGVKYIFAVGSGKGGVGKSTVAANIAVAMKQLGYKVGLFDGDIYGPSIPKMFGLEGLVPRVEDDKMIPVERYGVKVLSIGLMIEEDTPIIWRGPLVHKAYQQFFFDANWGDLDFLIVDFPPGTGDPQISAIQLVKLSGAVVVTTPQEVALADVRKAVRMFQKMSVDVLGVVENMSYFRCPKCGHVARIFGEGGGEELKKEMGIELLGEIPIEPLIVKSGDTGVPITAYEPESEASKVFRKVAARIAEKIEMKSKSVL